MSIKVTVSPTNSVVSRIKTNKAVVSSISFVPSPNVSLGQIANVDATDPEDGETLVYDADTGTYIVKPIVVDSNNITNIAGGIF